MTNVSSRRPKRKQNDKGGKLLQRRGDDEEWSPGRGDPSDGISMSGGSPKGRGSGGSKTGSGKSGGGDLPEIKRSFLVTHTSDNWKIRQLEKRRNEGEQNGRSSVTDLSPGSKSGNKNETKKSRSQEFPHRPVGPAAGDASTNGNPRWFERRNQDNPVLARHRQSVDVMMDKLTQRDKNVREVKPRAPKNYSVAALVSPRDAKDKPTRAFMAPSTSPSNNRVTQSSMGHSTVSNDKTPRGPPAGSLPPGKRNSNAYSSLDAISERTDSQNELLYQQEHSMHSELEIHKRDHVPPPKDEGFEDDDGDGLDDSLEGKSGAEVDGDEASSGFGEGVPEKRKKDRLPSEDYDTDLSEEGSDEEAHKAFMKNRTLMTYQNACVKCQIKPNRAFMRQCGSTVIDIRNRMVTAKEAKPISIALVDDVRAFDFDISDNPLGPLGASFVAEMLYGNSTIIELNMSNTHPEYGGLSALVQTLPHNKTLRRLYLDSNNLQQRDGEMIAEIIMKAPELSELHLEHNALGFHGIKQIGRALATSKGRLSVLNLQYNNIRTDSAVQIALSLAKNTTLRTLNLSWNGFGLEGCRALAVSLARNTTLKELDLTCNRLGIAALGFLIKGLGRNTGLSCLKVSRNPLTTEGAKALIAAISAHTESGLTDVHLKGVPIDEEFVTMADELRQNRVIAIHHDVTVHMGTSDMARDFDGNELTRYDPALVLFEYMKKDNLRVIDLFQLFDQKKRDKLSKSDLRDGVNTLMIPFTEDALDNIMETIDTNRDGYISLEEMMKGYQKQDKIVKQRRIKANKRGKPDKGLEELWDLLKELITKRKQENERRSVEMAEEANERRASQAQGAGGARRSSLTGDSRRGSNGGGATRRGSVAPGKRGSVAQGKRGSVAPGRKSQAGPRESKAIISPEDLKRLQAIAEDAGF